MKSYFLILILGFNLILMSACNTDLSQDSSQSLNDTIETASSQIVDAKKTEIIELQDGQSFDLIAEMVSKDIAGENQVMMAYNGSIPGPVIKVKQGSEITLNFSNNTDTPNTIHSHGLRLENQYDGVPDSTQDPVEPGDSFEYKLLFPDAGVYWYHPHMREDMTQELGLYGLFVVEPEDSEYWNPVNREEYIFLDDILINNDEIASFDDEVTNFALMGRYGNTMLINGETNYTMSAKKGETIRLAFANSANTRTFQISIPGSQMKLVGADNGRYEREELIDDFIIAPSERVIVEVYFPEEGNYNLIHKTPNKTYTLGSIDVSSEEIAISHQNEFVNLRENNGIRELIENFDTYLSKEPDKKLRLSVNMMGMGNMSGGHMMSGMPCHQMSDGSMMGDCDEGEDHQEDEKIEWEDNMAMMNAMSSSEMIHWEIIDEESQEKNMDIDWEFGIGDYMKISIFNDPESAHPMQHPIHFHGQRFLILKTNDELNNNLVWKDTTLVQTGDTVEILLEISNPGEWMVHCHIAEHLHSGMMMEFEVQ